MDSLYEQYIKERENLDVIKTDRGFITYRLDFPSCVINDVFVSKEHRQSGHAKFLTDQVFELCKGAGVKTVLCLTNDMANGTHLAKHAIENFGFELVDAIGPISRFKMEVSEWG